MPFRIYDPSNLPADAQAAASQAADRRRTLAERQPPLSLSNHRAAAPLYRASEELGAAINAALHLGAPLLLTGEPGTGKTQVAHHLAWFWDLPLFSLDVRSTTSASDLLYEFDSVAYFRAAQLPSMTPPRSRAAEPPRESQPEKLHRYPHIRRGPLWRAIDAENAGQHAIVLLDEIDKAPRDFPNDILTALDQARFDVPEWDAPGPDGQPLSGLCVQRRPGTPAPIVVITSNSERRLPEPFLRRCVFHHIEFTEELVRDAVQAHRREFARLPQESVDLAIQRFFDLRGRSLRKKPATAELLAWLILLSIEHPDSDAVLTEKLSGPLSSLPQLAVLVKDHDDYALLR